VTGTCLTFAIAVALALAVLAAAAIDAVVAVLGVRQQQRPRRSAIQPMDQVQLAHGRRRRTAAARRNLLAWCDVPSPLSINVMDGVAHALQHGDVRRLAPPGPGEGARPGPAAVVAEHGGGLERDDVVGTALEQHDRALGGGHGRIGHIM